MSWKRISKFFFCITFPGVAKFFNVRFIKRNDFFSSLTR